MKFIKLTAFLSCLFFTCTNAFAADQIIEIHLSGGTSVGSPSVFYMNNTQKKFCVESTCETTLTQLSELPTSTNPYVGTVINGVPLIQDNGQIITDDFIFSFTIPDSIYTAKNLFKSNQNTELHFTGTNASPSYITMNAATPSWMNPETGNQIFKLAAVPTSVGKKFLAFSTTENLADDGSLIVIDGSGNILSFAKSLSGVMSLYALWQDIPIDCATGQYLLAKDSACSTCPENSWCPGGTYYVSDKDQGINSCSDGTTSPGGSDSSDDCSVPSATTCLPGEFLPENSSTCSQCNANYWCPGGDFYKNNYAQGIASCPNGTISNWGATGENACHTPAIITCSAGNYLKSGSCSKCPENDWCPGGDYKESYTDFEGLNKCTEGLTSPEGSDSADDCTALITCPAGEFLPENYTKCNTCSANYWCPGGDFYFNIYVTQGRNICDSGLVSKYGSKSSADCHSPAIITCSPGTYMIEGGCSTCYKDYWCPGGDYKESYTYFEGLYSCPSGTTSPEGSDSSDDCAGSGVLHCNAGYYMPKSSSSCKLCLSANFCLGGDFKTNASDDQGLKACTVGTTSPEGSDSESDCVDPNKIYSCKAGTYLPANSITCSACKNNNWCPGGEFKLTTSDQGVNSCPNEGFSGDGADVINKCYKDKLTTVIPNGAGLQTCFYGTVGYTENCKDTVITSCDGGYYAITYDGEKIGFCTPVGEDYYSPYGNLTRFKCPGTKNIPDGRQRTKTDTSSIIEQCYVDTIFTTGTEIINGAGIMECFYKSYKATGDGGYGSAEIMNYNPLTLPSRPTNDPQCINQKMAYCFGGFFLENDSGLECGPVGDGYYSQRLGYEDLINYGCFSENGGDNEACNVNPSDYQSTRGREKCPEPYIHSDLPRNNIKDCYKECKLEVSNAKTVTPVNATIFYGSWGKDPEPACQYNVECNTGYKVVDNGTEKAACVSDGSCQNDPNAVESDSKCVPTKCKDGYHIESGKCIENVVACDIENGLGRKEWMGDNRLNGKWTMCTAYKCNPGYTSKRYLTNETDKPCGECKNRRDASGNIAVSAWKDDDCVIATCMYQGELYRLDSTGNKCVQICDTAGREDVTGTMLWNPLTEKCERTCNSGFTSW